MTEMKSRTRTVLFFILILLTPLTSYGEQGVGSLDISLISMSGERADYHGITLKIYQDNAKVQLKTIESLPGNPYKISLPLGHSYKIEAYANSMYASVGYVDLENNDEKLELKIPTPGSVRFTAVYNDGNTPIDNATIMVKSNDGTYKYWTNSTTDDSGNTVRFWLQPTILNDNYYVANVLIRDDLSYSYYPISILPGVSSDVKIITPWPSKLPPVTVSVYNAPFQKASKLDGNFVIQLYDTKGNKIAESKVNKMGEAYFSNLQAGGYVFHVISSNDILNEEWATANIILDGKQTIVQIFKNANQTGNENRDHTMTQGNMTVANNTLVTQYQIPGWVRNNAKLWSQNQVSDSDFIKGIQYLIEQGIMKIPATQATSVSSSQQIPSWIKSNAAWWTQGQISDDDFVKGVQYLISSGIMKISL